MRAGLPKVAAAAYRARFASDSEMAEWIERNGIGWVVLDTPNDSVKWQHNRQLAELLKEARPGWSKVLEVTDAQDRIVVYRISGGAKTAQNHGALLGELGPGKVANFQ